MSLKKFQRFWNSVIPISITEEVSDWNKSLIAVILTTAFIAPIVTHVAKKYIDKKWEENEKKR